MTTDQFAEAMYTLGGQGTEKVSEKEIVLEGGWRTWAIEEAYSELKWRGIEYFFVEDEVGYAIYFNSSEDEWAENKSVFDKLINSFRIQDF